MKALKHFCVAFTLILALSGLAFADGHIETAPKPQPPHSTTTVPGGSNPNEEQANDTLTELTLVILQNLFSLL